MTDQEDKSKDISRPFYQSAQFIIDSVRSLGLNIHPDSRLMRMYRVLCKPDGTSRGTIEPTDPDFQTALEALRDITQLEFVFDQINHHPEPDKYKSLVRRLIKDSVLPQDGRAHTPGRDAQVELFVFAVCHKAGLQPVFEEPDIKCSLGGKAIAVAVKRIKTIEKFLTRTAEGASQIQASGCTGIVSVEVTLALNPSNYRIIAQVPDYIFGESWRSLLKGFVDKYHKQLQQRVEGKGISGIILTDHCIRMDSAKHWRLETMTYGIRTPQSHIIFWTEFDEFIDRYLQGIPNLITL